MNETMGALARTLRFSAPLRSWALALSAIAAITYWRVPDGVG